jgi:hypothetical protein
MSAIEILTLLGGGALATEIVRGLVTAFTKRREGDTSLLLADKSEVGRIHESTQKRLEAQVDKLLAEYLEAMEAVSQQSVAKGILEFRCTALEKENAELKLRLNSGTTAGE